MGDPASLPPVVFAVRGRVNSRSSTGRIRSFARAPYTVAHDVHYPIRAALAHGVDYGLRPLSRHVAFMLPAPVPPLVPRFGDQLQLAVTNPFGYPLAESLSPLGVFLQMVSGPYLLAAGVQNRLDGLFQRLGHEHHVPGFTCRAGHRPCVASLFVRLFDRASRLLSAAVSFRHPISVSFIESVRRKPVAQARWRALDAVVPGCTGSTRRSIRSGAVRACWRSSP